MKRHLEVFLGSNHGGTLGGAVALLAPVAALGDALLIYPQRDWQRALARHKAGVAA